MGRGATSISGDASGRDVLGRPARQARLSLTAAGGDSCEVTCRRRGRERPWSPKSRGVPGAGAASAHGAVVAASSRGRLAVAVDVVRGQQRERGQEEAGERRARDVVGEACVLA